MANSLHILAIDNEPSVTTSLGWVFGPPRYRLNTVASGQAALAALDGADEPFDVIIVDQKMPNLTGVEVVTALHERGVKSRIIVLSAHVTDEVRQAYEELGVQAIFEKPPDIVQLRAAVDALPCT
ncbi:MAG TPA: response regulator [Chthoniobacterales bacterium]|jgi:DNA-binding response OmpR family regulator